VYKARQAIIDKIRAEQTIRVDRKKNWIALLQAYKAVKTNLWDVFIQRRENHKKVILLKYYSIQIAKFFKREIKRRAKISL
jgi:hypothetical protein